VAGRRTAPSASPDAFYQPCQHIVADGAACCATCGADAECIGWYFERMDCSAFGGGTNVGACVKIADTILGFQQNGAAGGSLYTLPSPAASPAG
jgi:hypothetical protein